MMSQAVSVANVAIHSCIRLRTPEAPRSHWESSYVPECLRISHYWFVLDTLRNSEDISRFCVPVHESLYSNSKKAWFCFSWRGTDVGLGVVSPTISSRDFGPFVNQLSVTIPEYLRDSANKEKRSIWGYSLRGFGPWPRGSVALGPVAMQSVVGVLCMVEHSFSSHHSQEAKTGRTGIPMSASQKHAP